LDFRRCSYEVYFTSNGALPSNQLQKKGLQKCKNRHVQKKFREKNEDSIMKTTNTAYEQALTDSVGQGFKVFFCCGLHRNKVNRFLAFAEFIF